MVGWSLTKEENIWKPEDRTSSNWGRVREYTLLTAPLISTRTTIPTHEWASGINALYREVRASLERQSIQPLIEYVIMVLVRYEEVPNGQLALEVGIVVEEARSNDPRMFPGTLPDGTSAMLPQKCFRSLAGTGYSEETDREYMGPADPRIIAEEGFEALEEWSVYEKKPLIGQPWIMFMVSPQDPQEVPVADAFVRFEVHRLLKN